MAYKVAVASSDGKFINRHFGRAEHFLVFEISDKAFEFLEVRNNTPPCSYRDHDDGLLTRAAELLSDCRIVLASQIGPGAVAALAAKGVEGRAVPRFIDEALNRLIAAGKYN